MEFSEDERKCRAANGPLYQVFDVTIRSIQFLSPVEWKKKAVLKVWPGKGPDDKRRIANLAIDLFIVLKWLFLLTIWTFNITNWFVVSMAVLLLIMNLHTYFWYHLWAVDRGVVIPSPEFRERRRFMNLIFAIAYSMALYAYLYQRVLMMDFAWPQNLAPVISALVFSIGNALTGFSGDLKPISATAHLVVSSQLVMTFVFVAMLLSNSVPRPRA